jgi:non-canonical (house-cleaning) NTP pyrophosphatase
MLIDKTEESKMVMPMPRSTPELEIHRCA